MHVRCPVSPDVRFKKMKICLITILVVLAAMTGARGQWFPAPPPSNLPTGISYETNLAGGGASISLEYGRDALYISNLPPSLGKDGNRRHGSFHGDQHGVSINGSIQEKFSRSEFPHKD